MIRRAWSEFLWWLDQLSALQAVAGYLLVGGAGTGVLLGTVGDTTASYIPFVAAFALFIVYCMERARGGWDVWGCGTGPGALAAILSGIFGLHGLVSGILDLLAVLLSLFLAWSFDRRERDRKNAATAD